VLTSLRLSQPISHGNMNGGIVLAAGTKLGSYGSGYHASFADNRISLWYFSNVSSSPTILHCYQIIANPRLVKSYLMALNRANKLLNVERYYTYGELETMIM
jgi:hypothetical protein